MILLMKQIKNLKALTQENGNTHSISATATTEDYTVCALQGHTSWYDEDVMTDPTYIDTLVRGVADVMTNQNTADIFGEMAKATLSVDFVAGTSTWFDTIVDAIYTYPYEDKSGLYIVVPTALIPAIIKDAGTKLQYVEDFYRTGAVGAIAGVPLYSTKAIPYDVSTLTDGDFIGFVGKRDAITNFMKKGLETETLRTPDTRKNDYWARKYNVVALTDATKVVGIAYDDGQE